MAITAEEWRRRISLIHEQLGIVLDLAQARDNKLVEPAGLDNPRYHIAATNQQVNQWSQDLLTAATTARDHLTQAVQAERA